MSQLDTETKQPKKSTLYTRTGDQGTSRLFTGERRNKCDKIFNAIGCIDELNAHLGLSYVYCQEENNISVLEHLSEIQSRLMDIMSNIATPRNSASNFKIAKTNFDNQNVIELEKIIDQLDSNLPKLTMFILPGSGRASAQLHVCRSVCRKAEREIVNLWQEEEDQEAYTIVYQYMNRLSDFLFVAARTLCYESGIPELTYKKGKGIQSNSSIG